MLTPATITKQVGNPMTRTRNPPEPSALDCPDRRSLAPPRRFDRPGAHRRQNICWARLRAEARRIAGIYAARHRAEVIARNTHQTGCTACLHAASLDQEPGRQR